MLLWILKAFFFPYCLWVSSVAMEKSLAINIFILFKESVFTPFWKLIGSSLHPQYSEISMSFPLLSWYLVGLVAMATILFITESCLNFDAIFLFFSILFLKLLLFSISSYFFLLNFLFIFYLYIIVYMSIVHFAFVSFLFYRMSFIFHECDFFVYLSEEVDESFFSGIFHLPAQSVSCKFLFHFCLFGSLSFHARGFIQLSRNS